MQMQFPDANTVGENALARFSRGPYDAYKADSEFSPVDAIVEEILGRLGCLRRNQRIVDMGKPDVPNSLRLMRDHDMVVLNIASIGDDSYIQKEYKNLTVEINMFNKKIDDIMREHGVPKELAFLSIDSGTIVTEYRPLVVAAKINPSTHPSSDYPGGFKHTNAFWNDKGYVLAAMADKYVVYVRSDLVKEADIKGVVLRNPDMLFDWKHIKRT
ncbi:hypothetical protein PBCVNEJV1_214R [Paramecium bursaria Chlorella virus NE-JV-1]|nr:hypothetical protein PBCVNEJV1_214R [Paramecium bursaria Chlorella virus NE-JV-1]